MGFSGQGYKGQSLAPNESFCGNQSLNEMLGITGNSQEGTEDWQGKLGCRKKAEFQMLSLYRDLHLCISWEKHTAGVMISQFFLQAPLYTEMPVSST